MRRPEKLNSLIIEKDEIKANEKANEENQDQRQREEKEEEDPMFKSMAARTTDHNGRIMVVNRKEKKLPKYPSSNVVGISDGKTIKYVPPTDTVASKLN